MTTLVLSSKEWQPMFPMLNVMIWALPWIHQFTPHFSTWWSNSFRHWRERKWTGSWMSMWQWPCWEKKQCWFGLHSYGQWWPCDTKSWKHNCCPKRKHDRSELGQGQSMTMTIQNFVSCKADQNNHLCVFCNWVHSELISWCAVSPIVSIANFCLVTQRWFHWADCFDSFHLEFINLCPWIELNTESNPQWILSNPGMKSKDSKNLCHLCSLMGEMRLAIKKMWMASLGLCFLLTQGSQDEQATQCSCTPPKAGMHWGWHDSVLQHHKSLGQHSFQTLRHQQTWLLLNSFLTWQSFTLGVAWLSHSLGNHTVASATASLSICIFSCWLEQFWLCKEWQLCKNVEFQKASKFCKAIVWENRKCNLSFWQHTHFKHLSDKWHQWQFSHDLNLQVFDSLYQMQQTSKQSAFIVFHFCKTHWHWKLLLGDCKSLLNADSLLCLLSLQCSRQHLPSERNAQHLQPFLTCRSLLSCNASHPLLSILICFLFTFLFASWLQLNVCATMLLSAQRLPIKFGKMSSIIDNELVIKRAFWCHGALLCDEATLCWLANFALLLNKKVNTWEENWLQF